MRVIKFRKWDFDSCEMIPGDNLAFDEYAPLVDLLSQEGIMQLTCVQDCNGVDLYEDDLVEDNDGGYTLYRVVWNGDRWHLDDPDGVAYDNGDYYYGAEVNWDRMVLRGNIYDQKVT